MNALGFDRSTANRRQVNGQSCTRGMRITVRRVVEAVAPYPNRANLFQKNPELPEGDLKQALEFAATSLEALIPFGVA
jgi:uncharacterized protein (DUF433 family)